MKRLLSVLLVLMMMPVSLTANANVDNALYPIRENGLWGYINRAGEVVIEPKDRNSVRLRCPKDFMADARVLKKNQEYTIQNMTTSTKTKIKIS